MHAFLLRVVNFLDSRRHLLHRAAIDDRHFGPKPQRRARRIHRHIAASDDSHALATDRRRVVIGELIRFHQVGARQVFVGRINADQVFSRDAHKRRQARARSDKDRMIAHFAHQLVERGVAADDEIRNELDAHALQIIDLGAHDFDRQAEFGDAIRQHAAEILQSLEHCHFMAQTAQIARYGQSGRTGADDGHPFAGRSGQRRHFNLARIALVIGSEPLQPADRHRLILDADDTLALALLLLGADSPADGRQRVLLLNFARRFEELAFLDQGDEAGNVDIDRTARDAVRLFTKQAAAGFELRRLGRIAVRHLVEIIYPILGRLFQHRLAGGLLAFRHFCLKPSVMCGAGQAPLCSISLRVSD
ncbi:MAG: hypothetical protein BWZ10_00699 [candidate division BRC1 bacterium ADurb.BinA364]|nr:MAG: hypothetical protein BWZ10_00699 [candidate division BRC1 bacterium ADurb.BinA364]